MSDAIKEAVMTPEQAANEASKRIWRKHGPKLKKIFRAMIAARDK